MKYFITFAVVAIAYTIAKYFFQFQQSVENVTFEIIDFDFTKFKIKARVTNLGNKSLTVTSIMNTIYVNETLAGTASNLDGFTLSPTSQKDIEFSLQSSIVNAFLLATTLFKSQGKKPPVKIVTSINAKGVIINKTTNI